MPMLAGLHDPNTRRFLFGRGPWEVRSPPGSCAVGCAWMLRGLWNLQFYAPVSGLSVLAFGSDGPFPFLVRVGDRPEQLALRDRELDSYLTIEWALPPSSAHFSGIVRMMEDKAAGSILRLRAGRLASVGGEPARLDLH